MISHARLLVILSIAFLTLFLVPSAFAQYMYLDSNGDGVHTAADAVNPSGPTTVDIWLDTAANRDGSPAACDVDASQILDIFSYQASLRATGGTISWGTFTNRQPTFSFHFPRHSSATEFSEGYGGLPGLPPTRYLLATLILTVGSGSPAIDIVPWVAVEPGDLTSFGSHCLGLDFDNTLKLGSDWHDADGLPFGTTGGANQPPSFEPLQNMTLATGELSLQTITATDPDRQPLTFSKISGPSFVTVATRDVGAGTATGIVAVAPLVSDVGTTTATISVTDGLASTHNDVQIQVTAGPNHTPVLAAIGSLSVVAGTTPRIALRASDSDGQPVLFEKLTGPDYLEVNTLTSGPGGAVGSLRLSPGLCDLGTESGSLQVTDGIAAASANFSIYVRVARAAAAQPPFVVAGRSSMVGAADLDGDGHIDLLAGGLAEPLYTLLGNGDGTFKAPTTQPLGPHPSEPTSVAFGDWNEDGRTDAAITVTDNTKLMVLFGLPSGGIGDPVDFPAEGFPWAVRSADLNGDGHIDLVLTHGPGFGVMLGHGDGTFAARTDYATGDSPRGLTIADFNRDGRPDIAVANMQSKNVTIRFGLGQGLFGDPIFVSIPGVAFDATAGDWNGDGKEDLAISDATYGVVRIYLGNGAGAFASGSQLSDYDGFASMEARDFNLDGNLDIVAALNTAGGNVVAYGNGDGTFKPKHLILAAESGLSTGDFNEDGFIDVVSTQPFFDPAGTRSVRVWLNDAGGAGMPEARAFAEFTGGGKPTTCVRLEPVAGSYQNAQLDPTSVTLSPEDGPRSVHAVTTKSTPVADADGNGIVEVPMCFPRDDVAAMFETKNGRQTVTARLEGALIDGRRFCTSLSLDIIGTGKNLAASLSPNPLNPGGILRLTTSRDGFIRVRMFDLQGRVVRVLEDRAMVPAGAHDVRIDGRNTAGQTLASGIYFYQVDTAEGSLKGRVTVLK